MKHCTVVQFVSSPTVRCAGRRICFSEPKVLLRLCAGFLSGRGHLPPLALACPLYSSLYKSFNDTINGVNCACAKLCLIKGPKSKFPGGSIHTISFCLPLGKKLKETLLCILGLKVNQFDHLCKGACRFPWCGRVPCSFHVTQ